MKDLLQTPYENMVVLCLKDRDQADFDAIVSHYVHCNERKLFDFANQHEVASIMAMRLRALGKSSPVWNTLADDWKYRLMQRFEKLDSLVSAFHAAEIPVMALKNAAIARAIYPFWEECPMGNFDLLVLPSDLERASTVLSEAGMAHQEKADTSVSREWSTELADDVLWIKLLTRPWYDPAGIWKTGLSAEAMFDHATTVEGGTLKIPEPAEHLLVVCMSIIRRRYVCVPGIRMYAEVDRIIRRTKDFPWNKFMSMARCMGSAMYFALFIPKMLLDTPIPEDVLDALRPTKAAFNRFMRVIRRVGLFYPPKTLPIMQECQLLSSIFVTPKDFLRACLYRER